MARLILASASPRRAELLTAAGFEFDVMPCDVDEAPRAGETADLYVRRLAMAKSAAAQQRWRQVQTGKVSGSEPVDGDVVILAADTAVVVDGAILGKPREADEARAMLRLLSGRRHDVLTGVSLRRGSMGVGGVEHSGVYFRSLGNEEVEWHVEKGEGADKAGGYAVQGLASRFVWRIEGTYANVVGLPVATVDELLRERMGWVGPRRESAGPS